MHTPGRTNPFTHRQPLAGGGREPFLARVRKGLGHSPESSPPPQEIPPYDESLVRQVAKGDLNRIERFITKAKENTMVVHRVVAEPSQIHAALDACLSNHTISKSALNIRDMDARFSVAQHLAEKNIAVVPWGSPACRLETFDCHASITDCRAGLADTGAIMVWSDPAFGRTTTLVVPVHIVLLPASRVMADLIDGLEFVLRENGGAMPSNVVVINGPSKTGDIEMKLVTGVHGPKFMYVILIDSL